MHSVDASWLAELCGTLPRARRAVVLRVVGPGEPAIECWPQGTPASAELVALANAVFTARAARCEGRPPRPGAPHESLQIGVPLPAGAGAVAVEIGDAKEAESTPWLERIRAGSEWLACFERRERAQTRRSELLELVALVLERRSAGDALVALATALATRFACERVAIGIGGRSGVRVEALSHSAQFDPRSQLLRDVAAAMNEACDQDATVCFPPAGDASRIDRAHAALVRAHGAGAAWTVPLAAHGELVGAMCFERSAPDARSVRLTEEMGALLGPLLATHRAAYGRPLERLRAAARRRFAWLARREGRWALAAGGALVALVLALPTPYRVTAQARLEGRVQRAIVAGIEGYLLEVDAKPGDVVAAGQLLARLDDRDLQLERRKWEARRGQLRVEHREALASHERTQLQVLGARIDEAEAQVELLDMELARAQLVAPFDGVIVSGDLRQRLGAPVEKGQVLLEIAPLDGYRVVLEVDERDVAAVSVGQRGRLALSALPGDALGFTVERVTPVAVAAEGGNCFRVEARLEQPNDALRPGLEGVAKIETPPRARAWIWTHDAIDWLRLAAWSWWP